MPRHQHLPTPPAPVRFDALLRRLGRSLLLCCVLVLLVACGGNPSNPAALDPTIMPTANASAALAAQPPRNVPVLGGALGTTVELASGQWAGGSPSPDGRTATFIYGTATSYSAAQTTFRVEGRPYGSAELIIEGLDAPGAAKTPIRILVNEHELYSGPNPLLDADQPAGNTPWDSYAWTFDAALLRQGQNTLTLANVAPGSVGDAPFVLLDHAELSYEER